MALHARFRRTKTALVLGCGPAGIFATHALVEAGWKVAVWSRKRRSEMFGAQYLHRPIPDLSGFDQPDRLMYVVWGTTEQYSRKVYGSTPPAFVSPAKLRGQHEVWDIRRAYYDAFARYADLIEDLHPIDADTVNDMVNGGGGPDLIVSTIPAVDICFNPAHVFRSQPVWAIGDAPERGVFCPVSVAPMTVICNGIEAPGWYRASNVFGYKTVEWPEETRPPLASAARVSKPTGTTCNCWGADIVKVGRYGAWDKGQYAHHGYYMIKELIGR